MFCPAWFVVCCSAGAGAGGSGIGRSGRSGGSGSGGSGAAAGLGGLLLDDVAVALLIASAPIAFSSWW